MTRKLKSISLGLLFLLSAADTSTASASTSTSSSCSQATKLDLSYLHRIQPNSLADVLRDTLQRHASVEIDLSSSLIGKDIQSIVSIFKDIEQTSTIDLRARSNQWSPKDGRALLGALLEALLLDQSKDSQSNQSEKSQSERKSISNAETTTTEENKGDDHQSECTPAPFPIHSLDLGWNYLGDDHDDDNAKDSKKFLKALQKLIEKSSTSPEPFILRLEVCGLSPAACRAIGKGTIDRYGKDSTDSTTAIQPMSLHLTKNEYIGDAGAAALSAAIRSIASKKEDITVFDVLNLSACGIGDTGAEALAIALEDHPSSVKHLILSNNHISDEGAAILGRALASSKKASGRLESLDLSHNKDIGDVGARELARTVEQGAIGKLVLRSCHVRADGISSFAKVLKNVGKRSTSRPQSLEVDLSGNPIGVLRKHKKSGGYSASALKSKATATTAAYMNMIGKTVQKGLKEIGLGESQSTLESDDDEEMRMNDDDGYGASEQQKETKCGALAFADAFLEEEDDGDEQADSTEDQVESHDTCTVILGLRHCALDTRAAEALAAVIHKGKEKMGLDIQADVRMNHVLEEDTVLALQGDKDLESDLIEMAETHLEAMERIRDARRRAMEATRAAADRMRAEAEMEAAWGSPVDMGDHYDMDYDEEDVWDSDADYDEGYDDYY